MTLIIPPEFKQHINPSSGFLDPAYPYSEKNLKGLFYSEINRKYLVREMYALLNCEKYIEDNYPTADLSNRFDNKIIDGYNNPGYFNRTKFLLTQFRNQKELIQKTIYDMVETYQLPFREDQDTLNPIQQLHNVNMDFLLIYSRNIIQNPQNLIPEINNINPDTGKLEITNWEYGPESYQDGVWHPEHLFTNSQRNRENPYWVPLEVNIYSSSEAKGTGHRYNDYLYNWGTYDYYKSDKDYNGNPKIPIQGNIPTQLNIPKTRKWKTEYQSNYGQFPAWQYTPNRRFYDRENTEGLDAGGTDDRRVQSPHGYNMKKLYSNPS